MIENSQIGTADAKAVAMEVADGTVQEKIVVPGIGFFTPDYYAEFRKLAAERGFLEPGPDSTTQMAGQCNVTDELYRRGVTDTPAAEGEALSEWCEPLMDAAYTCFPATPPGETRFVPCRDHVMLGEIKLSLAKGRTTHKKTSFPFV